MAVEDPASDPLVAKESATRQISYDTKSAYLHYRALYVRLAQIARKLEKCRRGLVQPQKAADAAAFLELVQTRLCQLHNALVKWHPALPGTNPAEPTQWEYIDFDDELIEQKLSEDSLELSAPQRGTEEASAASARIERWMKQEPQSVDGADAAAAAATATVDLSNAPTMSAGSAACQPCPLPTPAPDQAAALIQRHERGRQGRLKAHRHKHELLAKAQAVLDAAGLDDGEGGCGSVVSAARLQFPIELTCATSSSSSTITGRRRSTSLLLMSDREIMSADAAAVAIQRLARGHLHRQLCSRLRNQELVDLNMMPGNRHRLRRLEARVAALLAERTTQQAANAAALERAMPDITEAVRQEEGPQIRDKLRAQRMKWFGEMVTSGALPPDLDVSAFYAPPADPADAAAALAAGDSAAKGGKAGEKGGTPSAAPVSK